MSLFSNQNFINQIAKECGVTNLEEDVSAILQILVQIQTRRLIQQAAKFMKVDCRDCIDFQDIQNALDNLNHNDLILVAQEQTYICDGSSYIRRDIVYNSTKKFIQEQLKSLTLNSFAQPKLRARWIYLNGKIPRTSENNKLKAKTQIINIREKQIGQKHKKFNIIMDQPQSMLTKYQLNYFKETTEMLSQEGGNIGKLQQIDLQGNLSNLFPLFLKFFIGTNITQIKMVYFLELLKNKCIEKSTQFHLHQILAYLWAYQGEHCLQVGRKIGQYIKNLGGKYPMLYDIWMEPLDKTLFANRQTRKSAYCNAIKKIGIQLQSGVRVDISTQLLQWLEQDLENKDKDKIVDIFQSVINQYASRIGSLRNFVQAYWIPSHDNQPDCYMMMKL